MYGVPAREAIEVMANLTTDWGYVSSGESFSIGDPNEVFIVLNLIMLCIILLQF